MAEFTPDTLAFLKELATNNNRDWFEANRKRYEKGVKEPLYAFAGEMIERMQQLDPAIQMLPKQAVSRIHRDTRFSKDKSPYKESVYAVVSSGGKGYHATPGLYFNLGGEELYIASGLYFLEPSQVDQVRRFLLKHREEYEVLVVNQDFVRLFGEVQGEVNKAIAPDLRAANWPVLYQKQFFYMAKHPAAEALRDDLGEWVIEHMRAAWPLNEFLGRPLRQG